MRLPSADASPDSSRAALRGLRVTWLGHSAFQMTSPKGVRLLFDPFLTNNPSCPQAAKRVGAVDLLLITHGHSDHCEDAAMIARETGATVVASPELAGWLERQGAKHLRPMNIGGRQNLSGLEIAMVPAVHSSSAPDGTYLGPATGFVVRSDGARRSICRRHGPLRRHAPHPRFDMRRMWRSSNRRSLTMGLKTALAAEWLGVKVIVPMPLRYVPGIDRTVEELRRHAGPRGIDVRNCVRESPLTTAQTVEHGVCALPRGAARHVGSIGDRTDARADQVHRQFPRSTYALSRSRRRRIRLGTAVHRLDDGGVDARVVPDSQSRESCRKPDRRRPARAPLAVEKTRKNRGASRRTEPGP